MISPKFVILAALIILYSDVIYAADTLKSRNKPNRVTWALWSLAPLIAFAAQLEKGVGLQAVMTFSVGAAPLLVLAASFYNKKAYWKITRPDLLCGLVSLLALIVLIFTKQPIVAIILSIIADFFAGLPTLIKAWNHPESESIAPFLLGAFATLITLLTINHWHFATYSFIIYIFMMDFLIGLSAAGLKKKILGTQPASISQQQ